MILDQNSILKMIASHLYDLGYVVYVQGNNKRIVVIDRNLNTSCHIQQKGSTWGCYYSRPSALTTVNDKPVTLMSRKWHEIGDIHHPAFFDYLISEVDKAIGHSELMSQNPVI